MGNDLDVRFTLQGIELMGPVDEKPQKMLLKGFRIREVQPNVLDVRAHFDASDNDAGVVLLRRFLGFISSQPGGRPQLPASGELGTLDDRDDLELQDGEEG